MMTYTLQAAPKTRTRFWIIKYVSMHSEQAGTSISIALLHGGFAMHNFGISTFVASEKVNNTCADCDVKVDVIQGILFANNASACAMCDRPRCFKCATKSLGKPRHQRCLRCSPEPPAKAQSRKKK